jgi:hypothetical protein
MEGEVPDEWPLPGIKVIELGNFIAAPFASRLIAGFRTDAIAIEPPGASEIHNRANMRMSCEPSLVGRTALAAAMREAPVRGLDGWSTTKTTPTNVSPELSQCRRICRGFYGRPIG